MSEFNGGGWRKLTPAELSALGFSPRSERFINAAGETISYRRAQDIRRAAQGKPKLSQQNRQFRQALTLEGRARDMGFRSLSEARMIQQNEMYEAMERMFSLNAGGIPQSDIREFRSDAEPFNRALANVFRRGDWVIRPDPQYAKFGFGMTRARQTPAIRNLFELIGWDYLDDDEYAERVEWLRHY